MWELLIDEQNSFREKGICIDHFSTLTSIIRNQFAENKNIFCCFIDKEKAFDW